MRTLTWPGGLPSPARLAAMTTKGTQGYTQSDHDPLPGGSEADPLQDLNRSNLWPRRGSPSRSVDVSEDKSMSEVGPPRGTGRTGKALWTSIADVFELEKH